MKEKKHERQMFGVVDSATGEVVSAWGMRYPAEVDRDRRIAQSPRAKFDIVEGVFGWTKKSKE